MQIYQFPSTLGNCKLAIAVVPGWLNFYLKMPGLRSFVPHKVLQMQIILRSLHQIVVPLLCLLCIPNVAICRVWLLISLISDHWRFVLHPDCEVNVKRSNGTFQNGVFFIPNQQWQRQSRISFKCDLILTEQAMY